MSFFGNRRGSHSHGNSSGQSGSTHSHRPGQQCCQNHRPTQSVPGGALGQGGQVTMIQPGVETSPPGGLVGGVGEVGGVSGAGGAGGLDGLLGVSDFEDKLKAAPADVRAAAERLSLISAAADGIGGMDGIVTRAPGLDSTDTGKLSDATIASQLLVAVRTRDARSISRLCTTKSDQLKAALRRRDGQGHTLMHWAAKAGDVDVLEILADNGCPTNEYSSDSVGMSPLHWAATEGRLRASAWLLGPGGVEPEGRDNQGCTALVIAAQYGFVELVIYLSNHGCDLAAIDNVGDSALHWAAYKGHVQVLSMLVKAGQDPEVEDTYGQTPLHLAALRGNLDAAEYLVMEAKANVNARDKKNETPLDLALKKNQPSMELFLRTSGAGQSWLSPSVFLKLARTPRVWKAACQTGEGVQGARWPLPLNIMSMMFVIWMTMNYFYQEKYVALGHPNLLMASTVMQLLMWAFFLLTWLTNPGFVDPTDPKVSAAFHRRVEILSGHDKGSSGHSTDHDLDVEDPMENLLEIESGAGSVASPACYTCAIERPLRSRHCRNCRRCVRAFDHHCPFAGNCVGAANYRWFFSYVVTFVTSIALYMSMCLDWWLHIEFNLVVVGSAVYVAFFGGFGVFLFTYHTQLIQKNLTTSEHHALGRVDYLLAPDFSGQYYNPFDQGCMANCFARVTASHDTPPAELLARLKTDGSSPADLTNLNFDTNRT